ncbi:MAG: hypothetical protein ACI9K2_007297 [Myxococcota bacterium]|jgi:hypothetical protein
MWWLWTVAALAADPLTAATSGLYPGPTVLVAEPGRLDRDLMSTGHALGSTVDGPTAVTLDLVAGFPDDVTPLSGTVSGGSGSVYYSPPTRRVWWVQDTGLGLTLGRRARTDPPG